MNIFISNATSKSEAYKTQKQNLRRKSTHNFYRNSSTCFYCKISLIALLWTINATAYGDTPSNDEKTEKPKTGVTAKMGNSSNTNEKGKELAIAINNIYRGLPATTPPTFKVPTVGNDPEATDISAIVQKFIPLGINFDTAEAILRAADFSIKPRAQNTILSAANINRYNVYAQWEDGKTNPGITGRVILTLTPEKINSYESIGKVKAYIYKQRG